MVNTLLNAITKQLGTTFGNTYKYYVNGVEQNLTKPCFTVSTLELRERSKSSVLYDRTFPIVIHYFNDDSTTTNTDCYAVAETLIECLEYLPYSTDITLRGENMSWQMVDDVLQAFITYRYDTQKVVTPDDDMETVETDTAVSET